MGEYPKRAKLLLLVKYFERYTDEQHPSKMTDMLQYLKENGIEAERKAVYTDISLLRDLGYDIVKTTDGGAAYFLGERTMEIAEAEICASAVSAAKFITQKKSKELIDKLGGLFSDAQSAILRQRLELARALKTKNEEIYYNIDKIVRAQNTNKKISFLYFEYLPDKTLRLRKEGKRYKASPYTLMWFEDAYYLVCNIDKYDNLSHYRVDRMTKIEVLDEPQRGIAEVSEYKNYIDYDEYHRSVFSMFGGKPQNVRIRFRETLATAVFDRFGLDVAVSDIRDGWFSISVNVRVSPGFSSWLTIFGDDAEVIAPDSLKNEMKAMIRSLSRVYNN
ncbi:MAG: WYL domain-containing protein [Eubacteriales bacterium]|nr:WYL domain-containing protein [Eubacteriales bacterium]